MLASGRKRASVDSWRRCAWVIVASACIAALGLIFEVDGAVSVKTGARRFRRRQHRGGNDERGRRAPNVSHVALLVAGSTRSFVLPSGHGGMKRFLIDELERGSCVKVHTVMDLAVNGRVKPERSGRGVFQRSSLTCCDKRSMSLILKF